MPLTESGEQSKAVAELDWDMDSVMIDDPFEEATNLETKFYTEGYDSGHAHGCLHGLFEGRELGKEKAWELWEEVGYYEGWANMWTDFLGPRAVATSSGGRRGKEARALSHAQTLMDLVQSFPTVNPTPSSQPDNLTHPEHESSNQDLANLLSLIRARYRLLCSSLGTRPRLATAVIVEANPGSGAAAAEGEQDGVVGGIEGPMKGVDTRQLRF